MLPLLIRHSRKQFHHPLLISDTLQYEVLHHHRVFPTQFVPYTPTRAQHRLLFHTGQQPTIQRSRVVSPSWFIPPAGRVNVTWVPRIIPRVIVNTLVHRWVTSPWIQQGYLLGHTQWSHLFHTEQQPLIHRSQWVSSPQWVEPIRVPPTQAMLADVTRRHIDLEVFHRSLTLMVSRRSLELWV